MLNENDIKRFIKNGHEYLKDNENWDLCVAELELLNKAPGDVEKISDAYVFGFQRAKVHIESKIVDAALELKCCVANLEMLRGAILESESKYFDLDVSNALNLVELKLRDIVKGFDL